MKIGGRKQFVEGAADEAGRFLISYLPSWFRAGIYSVVELSVLPFYTAAVQYSREFDFRWLVTLRML